MPDGVADEFLCAALHGSSSQRHVNAAPDQKFKGGIGSSEIYSLRPEAFQFLSEDKSANFSLDVGCQRLEDKLLVESSNEFGPKMLV